MTRIGLDLQNDERGPVPRVRRLLTPAELAARRRNAQKSTGPRTAAGKRRSSLNALKHGLCSALLEARIRYQRDDPAVIRRLARDLACVLEADDSDLRRRVRGLAEAWWPKLLLLQRPLGPIEWHLFRKADERIEEELASFMCALSFHTRKWRYRLEKNFGPHTSTLRALRLKVESRLGTLAEATAQGRRQQISIDDWEKTKDVNFSETKPPSL